MPCCEKCLTVFINVSDKVKGPSEDNEIIGPFAIAGGDESDRGIVSSVDLRDKVMT